LSNVVVETGGDGRVTIRLARAERHNAFDDVLIADLTAAFEQAAADPAVRVVVLASSGQSFSAGADLAWMKRMATYSEEENYRDASALARLLQVIDGCPKPVVALVQGPAYGGGVGLIAACDIAIAADGATFALTEVKLGLIPAVISPYVIAAIGQRASRRYFLSAERFSAVEAHRLGLVHEVVPPGDLAAAGERVLAALIECGPSAQTAAKELIRAVAYRVADDEVAASTAQRIAAIRASAEGREGIAAFLEKRKPCWR
jgi:methylglutaconyl-CoA hydratase